MPLDVNNSKYIYVMTSCCKVHASCYKATSVTSNIITECPNNDSDEDDKDLYDSVQEEDFDGQHSESTPQRRGDGEYSIDEYRENCSTGTRKK